MIKEKLTKFSHIGTMDQSGRYVRGSGDTPYQSGRDFAGEVKFLRKQGMTDTEIARGMGMSSNEFRSRVTADTAERKSAAIGKVIAMRDERQMSTSAIARELGIPEPTVRGWLKNNQQEKSAIISSTADMLKKQLEDKPYLDVGSGVELYVGVSAAKIKGAIKTLQDTEGYKIHNVKLEQQATGKSTTVKILTGPDKEWKDAAQALKNAEVQLPSGIYTENKGRTYLNIKKPVPFSADRVYVRYSEDKGTDRDGVIELRRGVEDLDLGKAQYAQVRVNIDNTHYLKGMAIYSDNIPDGYDVVFNTNKSSKTPKLKVFKELKTKVDAEGNKTKEIDWDNPFGATIKNDEDLIRCQSTYTKNGKKMQSALNIVNEEGGWDKWSKTISAQMLSKQNIPVIRKQLDLLYEAKEAEYNEIMSLSNNTVKKRLLQSFSDEVDSASVDLHAAGFKRQAYHVILPVPELKTTEIYAPKYTNGEEVVLIRFPHGGTFEIPNLKVNNNNRAAKSVVGNAVDAVGINPKVAEQLSGADFDGDTVIVIPTRGQNIKADKPLKDLDGFDAKQSYSIDFTKPKSFTGSDKDWDKLSEIKKGEYLGIKVMTKKNEQTNMGSVSNLITDMTIKGADFSEIARAVKHSMVVIDAKKHFLDYQQSFIDNRIGELKKKYQGKTNAGASTIISRTGGQAHITNRVNRGIDPDTGAYIWEDKPMMRNSYNAKTNEWVKKEVKVKTDKGSVVKDAYELVGSKDSLVEQTYAEHSNRLKALANKARKTMVHTADIVRNPEAAIKYKEQVETLNAKLEIAKKNAPLERQAQMLANYTITTKRRENPHLEEADMKRLKDQALSGARFRTGAGKERVNISDIEWEAIQAGAISKTKLNDIISNGSIDQVKQYATPRTTTTLSGAKQSKAVTLLNNGNSISDVAKALGVTTAAVLDLVGHN